MPRDQADRLGLSVHIALDAMRRGKGTVAASQALTQTMILAGLLAQDGYGEATFEQMRAAEKAICAAFDRGRDTGEWFLDDTGFRQFAVILTLHDAQLKRAPLSAVARATEGLERFVAGKSLDGKPH